MFTHIVPKTGNTGAHLVACAGQNKVKLIVLGSRGVGAFKQCAMLSPLFPRASDRRLLRI